ncbi:MAG: PmoA family protein, partial [Gemmataceae bacterium]|nr:PmoA family protein [Gemmataceae bacterium]MDW8266857.1 PmoA family protein [Gemmataceae bacterium]
QTVGPSMNYQVPHVQIVPLADDQVSFQVGGQERLRWHAAPRYPRPFFFPWIGPSGRSVLRLGHPAAPDHGHHRALWWGHRDIGGVNFWEERGGSQQIRQETWVHYQDGHDEAGMVVRLGWFDSHKVRLLEQELIAVFRPLEKGESWLELQTTFTPATEQLPIGKTNFGFLGLRVAASISAQYGGGRLTSSEGGVGEQALFARPARWMDYSGPMVADASRGMLWEGITWFDHPANPRHPPPWHVRDDGWMSAAFCLNEGYTFTAKAALTLRYGLHLHAGPLDRDQAEQRRRAFAASAGWEVVASERPWRVRLRRKAAA